MDIPSPQSTGRSRLPHQNQWLVDVRRRTSGADRQDSGHLVGDPSHSQDRGLHGWEVAGSEVIGPSFMPALLTKKLGHVRMVPSRRPAQWSKTELVAGVEFRVLAEQ